MAQAVFLKLCWTILQIACMCASHAHGLYPEDCDVGWSYSDKVRGCYIYKKCFSTYGGAVRYCESLGASITFAKSPEENEFINKVSGGSLIWLGGTNDKNFHWTWRDGTPFGWTQWNSGYPKNVSGSCLFQGGGFNWWSITCGTRAECLCSITDAVRIVGGVTKYAGRVEVYYDGSWGTVCGKDWDDNDARVVCRELGYSGGEAKSNAYFGPGIGHVWHSSTECIGSEYYLASCPRRIPGEHSCTHEFDAGVICDAVSKRTIPQVTGVLPQDGPISGGSELTINVINLRPKQLGSIKIGAVRISTYQWTPTAITFLTPKGLVTEEALSITLQLKDGSSINSPFTFTYKPDPMVSNIYPLETIRSGGTKLTVEGRYLDSVSDPALKLTLSTKNQAAKTKQIELTKPCDKDTVTFSKMKCRTPNTTGYIREDQVDYYELYLGLSLDGVPTYRNLTATLPEYSQLQLFSDPIINGFEERVIEPGKYFSIEGKSMTRGCTVNDYNVTLGHGQCTIDELLDNELLCLPPYTPPTQKPDEHNLGTNRYYLLVQIGYSSLHQVGVVRYNEGTISLSIIIGCSVAGLVFMNLAFLIGACIWKRRKPTPPSKRRERNGINMAAVVTSVSIGTDMEGFVEQMNEETRGQIHQRGVVNPAAGLDMGTSHRQENDLGYLHMTHPGDGQRRMDEGGPGYLDQIEWGPSQYQ